MMKTDRSEGLEEAVATRLGMSRTWYLESSLGAGNVEDVGESDQMLGNRLSTIGI